MGKRSLVERNQAAEAGEYRKAKRAKRPKTKRKTQRRIGLVYFMQTGGEGGPIKIGVTTTNPWARFETIMCGLPYDLALVAVVVTRDAYKLEKELHQRFDGLSIRGEWFKPALELLEWISANAMPWVLTRTETPRWWFTYWDTRTIEQMCADLTAAADGEKFFVSPKPEGVIGSHDDVRGCHDSN
jgi:hypothetical protein